jgi:hypothetical protein
MSTCFYFQALNHTVEAVVKTTSEMCKTISPGDYLSCGIREISSVSTELAYRVGRACIFDDTPMASISKSNPADLVSIFANTTLEACPDLTAVVRCIVDKLASGCDPVFEQAGSVLYGVLVGVAVCSIAVGCCVKNKDKIDACCSSEREQLIVHGQPSYGTVSHADETPQSSCFQRFRNYMFGSSQGYTGMPHNTESTAPGCCGLNKMV